jgi:hypothetical protein
MSPRVRLVFYPDGDDAFASHTTVSLRIDLPPEYSAREVITAVEDHLRERYPLAAIQSQPAVDGGKFEATWHVYRDGLPVGEASGPA